MELAPKIGGRDNSRFLTHANRGQKSEYERELDAQIAAKKKQAERERVLEQAETIRHYKDYNFAASPRRDADLERLIRDKERDVQAQQSLLSQEHREQRHTQRQQQEQPAVQHPPPARIGFPTHALNGGASNNREKSNLYANQAMNSAAALVGSAHAGESERDRRLRLRAEERNRRRMGAAAAGGGGGGNAPTPSVYGDTPQPFKQSSPPAYEPTPYAAQNGGGGGGGGGDTSAKSRRDQIWEEKRRRHLEGRQRMLEDTPAATPEVGGPLSPRALQRKSLKERETEREYERERARMMSAQARFDQHAGSGAGGPQYPTSHPAAGAQPSPRGQDLYAEAGPSANGGPGAGAGGAPLWAQPSANRPVIEDDNNPALGGSIFGGLGEGDRHRKKLENERKAEMQAFMAGHGGQPAPAASNPRHGRRAHQEPTPKIGSPRVDNSGGGGLFAGLGDKAHDPGRMHAQQREQAQLRFQEQQSHVHNPPAHGRRAVNFAEEADHPRQEYNPTSIPADYRQRQQSAPANRPRQTQGRRASLDDTQTLQAAEKKSYAQELQEQMRMKEEAKRLEKQREREAERRQMEYASTYSPFGRGGAGAPLTDESGNTIADLNPRHMEEHKVQYNPLSPTKIPPQPNFGNPNPYGGMPPPQQAAPPQGMYGQAPQMQMPPMQQAPQAYQAPPPVAAAAAVAPQYMQQAPAPIQQPAYGQPMGAPQASPTRGTFGGNSGPPASSKAQYMRDLQEQIEAKKRAQAEEKARRDYEDRKKDLEIANYNPFGRGGAGAPVIDPKTGEAVANLKKVDPNAQVMAAMAQKQGRQQQQQAPPAMQALPGGGVAGSMAAPHNNPYLAFEAVAPNVEVDNRAQEIRAASEQQSHIAFNGMPPPGVGDHTRPSFASFDPNIADHQRKKAEQAAKQKAELEAQIEAKEREKQMKAQKEREDEMREEQRLARERAELAAQFGAEEEEKKRKETLAEEQKRQAEEARAAKARKQAEIREKDRQAELKAKREQEEMARAHEIEMAKERGEEPPPPLPSVSEPVPPVAPSLPSPTPLAPAPVAAAAPPAPTQPPAPAPVQPPLSQPDPAFSGVLNEAAQLPPAHMRSARGGASDTVSATALKVEMMNDLRREFNMQHEQLRHQLEKQEEEVRTLRATASEARRDAEDASRELSKVQHELNAQRVEQTKAEFDRIQQKLPPKYGRRSPRGNQDVDSAQQQVLRQQAADISDIRKSMASDSRLVYPDGHTSVLSSMSQVTSGGPTPEPVAGRRAPSREGSGRRSAPRWQGRDRGRGRGNGVAYNADSLNIDSLYDKTEGKLKDLDQLGERPEDLDNDQVDALLSNFLNARKDRRPRPLTPERMETSLRAETAFVPGV